MDNRSIANIFFQICDILEIKGENVFKVRAYQKAARAIENLSESLAVIHQRGELESIDGIGQAIAEKIGELLETGVMSFYEKEKASIPEGLLDLLRVPGMGPKKVKLVYDQLEITSIPALKEAARAGKLQTLPGMGKKSEEKILKGIELLEQSSGIHTLGKTLPIAQEIVNRIRSVKGVQQLEIAGSLRRGKETVGDVDILTSAKNPQAVMEEFLRTPAIRETLAHGSTKTSILLDDGLQVDLRVVADDSFGAALQYFTGSKEHNVKLRELAARSGYKVNEYGVFDTASDKKTAGETEESVYRSLGLAWIPPELREGFDEIELAQQNHLPPLIERKDIISSLHNHTTASDGRMSLAELVTEAKKRGYRFLAVTDHSGSLGVANGLSPDRLRRQMDEIHEFNEKHKDFRVLTGTEVDIKSDASLAFPDELLQELDFVIAAIHTGFDQPQKQMMERISSALQNPHVDMISHPTGRLIGQRPPLNIDPERLFSLAAETKTILEINSYYLRLDLNDKHIREAKQHGVTFAIETDTHGKDDFDQLAYGIKTARRGRLVASDVINTLSVDQLHKWLTDKSLNP
ncbi:MAG: DNA polymerase/3'-5' exonuclease PolX [Candidatus Omnitrophota bacterium]|jgi:DNA polymerase (family 10)|nr:MAG: DNA polymerase/3'-5' exonuclease PolX [Candidatus Omnitrophota bacterium]